MKYSGLTLGKIEAVVHKLGGLEGVDAFLRDELVVSPAEPEGSLCQIAIVPVPGADRFVADDAQLDAANIGETSDRFKRLFLGKVEKAKPATIAVSALTEISSDVSIRKELGDNAEILLTHFFELLERQASGQVGPLLNYGYTNIAYIRGIDGNLWAVGAIWNPEAGRWNMRAVSPALPARWRRDDCRVVSRVS